MYSALAITELIFVTSGLGLAQLAFSLAVPTTAIMEVEYKLFPYIHVVFHI